MDTSVRSGDLFATKVPKVDYYELKLDPIYCRIRTRFDIGCIEVGLWKGQKLLEVCQGHRCQDLYTYMLEKYTFSNLHSAYLGKELKKAEISMATGATYYQE